MGVCHLRTQPQFRHVISALITLWKCAPGIHTERIQKRTTQWKEARLRMLLTILFTTGFLFGWLFWVCFVVVVVVVVVVVLCFAC